MLPGLDTMVRQTRSLDETVHRPWPVPERTWLLAQSWEHLLFAHWAVPRRRVEPLLPERLQLDTFDGQAWLGITPFSLIWLRPHGLAPLPLLSSSLELNVRTYVTIGGKPGIWFFSLDASSLAFVLGARAWFALPYARARMSCRRSPGHVDFESTRTDVSMPEASFSARYRPEGPVRQAQPGSLEHFLVERYCLYAEREGALERTDIHHRPWPLQRASGEVDAERQLPPELTLPRKQPLLHYARRLDVLVWSPRGANAAG